MHRSAYEMNWKQGKKEKNTNQSALGSNQFLMQLLEETFLRRDVRTSYAVLADEAGSPTIGESERFCRHRIPKN